MCKVELDFIGRGTDRYLASPENVCFSAGFPGFPQTKAYRWVLGRDFLSLQPPPYITCEMVHPPELLQGPVQRALCESRLLGPAGVGLPGMLQAHF